GLDPTVTCRSIRREVGGDDNRAELRHCGSQRLLAAAEAQSATTLGEHAVLLKGLENVDELPLLAMKHERFLQLAAPVGIDRLTELALRAKLRRGKREAGLGVRTAQGGHT